MKLLRSACFLGLVALISLRVEAGRGQEYASLKLVPATASVVYGDGRPRESIPILAGGSEIWLRLADLSAILQSPYSYRADVQKLILRVGGHRLHFAVGSEIARLDGEESIHLPGPVLRQGGQIYLPFAAFLDAAGRPYSWLPQPLVWSGAARRLRVGAPPPGITAVKLESAGEDGHLVIYPDRPVDFRVERATRARTIVRLPGVGLEVDSLAVPVGDDRFRAIALVAGDRGSELSFAVPDEILGYRILRLEHPSRIEVSLTDSPEAVTARRFSPFPESGLGDTLALSVIVLDPGGGGEDDVRTPGGQTEGELTLAFCRALARRLEDSLGVRAELTRDRPGRLSDDERIEVANRALADLFVSIHYDRGVGARAVPRAFVAPPVARRTGSGVSRSLAELGFEVWGQSSGAARSRSLKLASLLVGALAGPTMRGGGSVDEAPVPLLLAATMPAAYLVVDDVASEGIDRRVNDPDALNRSVAALTEAIAGHRQATP